MTKLELQDLRIAHTKATAEPDDRYDTWMTYFGELNEGRNKCLDAIPKLIDKIEKLERALEKCKEQRDWSITPRRISGWQEAMEVKQEIDTFNQEIDEILR